jgi:hypothetical protein
MVENWQCTSYLEQCDAELQAYFPHLSVQIQIILWFLKRWDVSKWQQSDWTDKTKVQASNPTGPWLIFEPIQVLLGATDLGAEF